MKACLSNGHDMDAMLGHEVAYLCYLVRLSSVLLQEPSPTVPAGKLAAQACPGVAIKNVLQSVPVLGSHGMSVWHGSDRLGAGRLSAAGWGLD